MRLLLSREFPKVTSGIPRARKGSAANHEIICRRRIRP